MSVTNEVQALREQVSALDARIEVLLAKQNRQAELFEDLAPVLKDAMRLATEKLQSLDERGYVGFGRELRRVADQIVGGYDAEDVRKLGDNIVGIVDTVRSVTQPDVVKIVHEAAEALHEADEAKPTGLLGMLKRSRDDEVRRGMAVALEVLRHIGRATADPQTDVKARRKARMARMLAPSRRLSAPTPAAAEPQPTMPRARKQVTVPDIPGCEFDAQGFLITRDAWTREVATQIALCLELELSDHHWQVLEWIRADYAETGASPNVRRIAKGSGVGTHALYELFVRSPGVTAARLAGVPKPVGCI